MAATVTPSDAAASQSTRLDEWISMQGPLWPPAALVLALETCAGASRLAEKDLGRVIGSLNATGVTRCTHGGWSWMPTPDDSTKAKTVTDAEIIERIGAILFHALSGQPLSDPFAGEQSLRTRLRTLRPDLSATVVDVSVQAIVVRQRERRSLAAFADDLRQSLDVERASKRRGSRRTAVVGGAALVLAVISGIWWRSAPRLDDWVDTHGLTRGETIEADVTSEAAETFALIDEHTAAIQLFQHIGQLWRAHVAPDDPRLAWSIAHEAWVRTIAGDRLTAEQLLVDAQDWLARALGDSHPYTRAARLALADALDARDAAAEAAALRDKAAAATRHLLGQTWDLPNSVPEPPGVIAHVAPNRPEQEGFRQAPDGGSFAPMTSAERWLAGRDGWRLDLVAEGTCRARFVAGAVPRTVVALARRAADGSWQVLVEGTTAALTLHHAASERIHVALVGDPDGSVQAQLGGEPAQRSHIATTEVASPPYALSFDEVPNGRGCAVVWLEIPFPSHPK